MICHVEQLRRCDKQPRTCVKEREWAIVIQDNDCRVIFGLDMEGEMVGSVSLGLALVESLPMPENTEEAQSHRNIIAYLRAIKRARRR